MPALTQSRVIQVDDQPEHRIRKPVDALLCVLSSVGVFVLAAGAVAASATAKGAETDIVGASRRLPHSLLVVVPPIALFVLLILPVGLAVAQLVRRQVRRLAEALATGIMAGILTWAVNDLIERPATVRLHDAIIMSHTETSHAQALDPPLVGLVAYATIIGLAGRPAWRNALGTAIGAYAVVQLAQLNATILTLLITLLTGHAIGLAVRYCAGTAAERPSARAIAAALTAGDLSVAEIRRLRETHAEAVGSRHYEVVAHDGRALDVVVFDRDQQAAGTLYRVYRWVRLQGQVAHQSPLSVDRTVERSALLSYAMKAAGVATPPLVDLLRVGVDTVVLAYEHCDGITLAQRQSKCTDEELSAVWDAVRRLHACHVAHRGLTANRILFTPGEQVMLLDPSEGNVPAGDLQVRLDLAQLIAELALYVGPERSARLAVEQLDQSELTAVLPLLQPVALVRSTRHALRRRREVLPAVRKALLAAVPGGEVAPVHLQRVRARTLLTLAASVIAFTLLAGELTSISIGSLLARAQWPWIVVALLMSGLTYVGASLTVSGFVTERLGFARTVFVQLAGSFVALVMPAAVGGVALNVRYLQRRKIPSPVAVASIAVSQVVAFVLHVLLLVMFAAITGTETEAPIRPPPAWSYFVVAGLVVLAGGMLALPAGRRLARARLAPTFGQVLPQLTEIAQRPAKLAEGLGGALLLSIAYILCLAACVKAFGGSVPLANIGFVYMTGATIGSVIPTPGGLGPVEAALILGLSTAGMPGSTAFGSVILFRLLTFWLPVPLGWGALRFLERRHDL
ncbi:MAG: lysylphosphatidylglycerol synthase domain-containing protein [Trebonia sp.]